jgi:hypothetical protein
MAIADYNNFCKNPLTLEERFPTIEEFALAFNDFFALKEGADRLEFDEKKNSIIDGLKQDKRHRNLGKDEVIEYLNFFDLNGIDCKTILDKYIYLINGLTGMGTTYNTYIRSFFRWLFINVHHLRESPTNLFQIANIPVSDDGNDFFNYINNLDENEILSCLRIDAIKKNFSNWKTSNVKLPQIRTVLDFLNAVNSDNKIVNKEAFLASWFYSCCYAKYPCNEKEQLKYMGPENIIQYFEDSPYADRMKQLPELANGAKDQNKKETIIKEIDFLKEHVPPSDYPVLLFQEFNHAVALENYDAAIELGWIIAKIFFYVGSAGNASKVPLDDHTKYQPSAWFCSLITAVAHISLNYSKAEIKKSASKLFSRLTSYCYLTNFNMDFLGYKEERDFSSNNSEKADGLKKYWAKLFYNIWLPSSFYNKKEQSYDFCYDPNKVNQKIESFGSVDGYAIEIASQINDFNKVKALIDGGANVAKTKTEGRNALYWSLSNMMLFLPIGFWRITIHPHSGEHLNDESLRNFIVPHWETTFQSLKNYHKIHSYERKKAYDIFLLIIQKYIDDNIKADELYFGTDTLFYKNNEDILSAIISRIAQYDVLIKLMSVYDISTFKKNNINYIFMVLGTYSNLWAYKNGMHHNNAPEWFSKMKEYSKKFMGINANADAVIQGNQREYNYYLSDYVFPSSCEFIDELDLLQILKLLIENHFDPYIGVTEEPCPEKDCVLYAIEMGWLDALKLLCPYIKQEFPEKWIKYKKMYCFTAIYVIRPSPCKYPSQDTYEKIATYLTKMYEKT